MEMVQTSARNGSVPCARAADELLGDADGPGELRLAACPRRSLPNAASCARRLRVRPRDPLRERGRAGRGGSTSSRLRNPTRPDAAVVARRDRDGEARGRARSPRSTSSAIALAGVAPQLADELAEARRPARPATETIRSPGRSPACRGGHARARARRRAARDPARASPIVASSAGGDERPRRRSSWPGPARIDEEPAPGGLVRVGAPVGRVDVVARRHARDPDVAAERQGRDGELGLAAPERERAPGRSRC